MTTSCYNVSYVWSSVYPTKTKAVVLKWGDYGAKDLSKGGAKAILDKADKGLTVEAKCINIGLLGLGTVGSGVVQLLTANQDHIAQRAGLNLKVKKSISAGY